MKKRIFTLAILLLTFTAIAFGRWMPDIIVTGTDGIWTDTRFYASIDNAVAAALATGEDRDIYIVRQEVTDTLTIHPAAHLHFYATGSIANTGQLTINSTNFSASNRQIFTGAGDIDWIAGSVVKTSWFSNLDEAFDVTYDHTLTMIVTEAEASAANMEVGDDVTLKWNSPFILSIGGLLSNVKNIEAGNYQIFAGAGDIDFLDGTRLKLDWFNMFRTMLAWVEAENVTVVVSGENAVTLTNTVDANIVLDFTSERGSLALPGLVTLTIDSPHNIIATSRSQIFSGDGAIEFTHPGPVFPEYWGENTTPGTTVMELQAAIDALNAGGGGDIYYAGETYLIDDTAIYSNISHHGVYGATILERRAHSANNSGILQVNPYPLGDTDPANNIRNILIEDIIFDGSHDTLGLNGNNAGVRLSGATDITIQRCQFINQRGDGILLDSWGGIERHNERINILHNLFDGWDGSAIGGRNAVSIIDGVDILIKHNRIIRTGTAGQPGGIDVEPGIEIYQRVQNITIESNAFSNNTNAIIQIALNYADSYTLHPKGFKIINNHIDGTNTGNQPFIWIRLFNSVAPYLVAATDEPNGVLIEGNHIDGHTTDGAWIYVTGTKGTIIRDNTIYKTDVMILGSSTSNIGENNYDLTVDNNIFDQSGDSVGQIRVGNNDVLKITNNIFRDPNYGNVTNTAIHFYGTGVTTTSSYVTISGNQFVGTVDEAVKVTSHTLSPETNRWFGNTVVSGATNEFLYDSPDDNTVWGDWDFDVDGGAQVEHTIGSIPDNARIVRSWYQVITAFTSGGAALVNIGINGDDPTGIQAELAFDNAVYTQAFHDSVPDGTVANFTVQTTGDRNVIFEINDANLTAGKIRIWWEYVIGE